MNVYINVFNRLTTTRILCDQIAKLDNASPVIIDNASDYGPLLDWYADCPYEVIRLRENIGHHAPWLSGVIDQDRAPFYVVTDCDLDLEGVPADCLAKLQEPFAWTGSVWKNLVRTGLALRIDDLPPWQTVVKQWEERFWKQPLHTPEPWYVAPIDTTFALYRAGTTMHQVKWISGARQALRLGGQYTARHMPWYLDPLNLDEENEHYFATANGSNSWRPQGQQLVARYAVRGRHASGSV